MPHSKEAEINTYFEHRLLHVELAVDDIKNTLNRLDAKFEKIDDRFDKIDAKFEKIDDRFERLIDKIDNNFKWLVTFYIAGFGALLGIIGRLVHLY